MLVDALHIDRDRLSTIISGEYAAGEYADHVTGSRRTSYWTLLHACLTGFSNYQSYARKLRKCRTCVRTDSGISSLGREAMVQLWRRGNCGHAHTMISRWHQMSQVPMRSIRLKMQKMLTEHVLHRPPAGQHWMCSARCMKPVVPRMSSAIRSCTWP